MREYIRYEVGERKYSSNIVLGIYEVWNTKKQKMEEEQEKLIAPLVNKTQGDLITQNIVDIFNIKIEQ